MKDIEMETKIDLRINIKSKEQFKLAFGIDVDGIKGMDKLTEEERDFIAEKGIFDLVNSSGLEYKEELIVYKVEKLKTKLQYKLYTRRGYSLLYYDGDLAGELF